MTTVFTDYLRSLAAGDGGPTSEELSAILRSLRAPLIREMKRKSLWNAPPTYLGYVGASSWSDPDLFEELVADCYEYIFIDRLRALMARLDLADVEGLVLRNLRNFLHEARRRHDPIGARLYDFAYEAVEHLLEEGRLHRISGASRLDAGTVLAFRPGSRVEPLETAELETFAVRWNDALLSELMTAWQRGPAVERLADAVADMASAGVEAFSFRSLVLAFQGNGRARWQALFTASGPDLAGELDAGGELLELVQKVEPDTGFEQRQDFARLVRCVEGEIDRHPGREKTRRHLRRLWLYVRHQALETASTPKGIPDRAGLSRSKLGRELGIPRQRIDELRTLLGGMVETCGRGPGEDPPPGLQDDLPPSPSAPRREDALRGNAMGLDDRRENLRRRTAEAARSLPHPGKPEPPRAGDVVFLPGIGDAAVDWLWLASGGEGASSFLAVPCDDFDLVGRRDLRLRLDSGELRVARLAQAVEEPRSLDGARAVGRLDEPSLELVTEALASAQGGESDDFERGDIEHDAEYRAWMISVQDASDRLASGAGTESKPPQEAERSPETATSEQASPEQASPEQTLRESTPAVPFPSPGSPTAPDLPPSHRARRSHRRLVERLAASLLVLVTGTLYFSQRATVRDLAADREQLQQENSAQGSRLEDLSTRLDELEARRRGDLSTIAELERRLGESGPPQATPGARAATALLRLPEDRGPRLAPVELPAGADFLVLLVEIAPEEPLSHYRAEVEQASTGRRLVVDEDLVTVGAAFVSVTLHRTQLADGDYRLVLEGVDGSRRIPLGDFEVEITVRP